MKNFAYRYFSTATRVFYETKRPLPRFDTVVFARKGVATLLSGVLVFQPMLVQAQVAPDTGAPIGNQPGIGAAPNGVPLVDIVTPNGQGLSHNKYNDFNVGTPGLILNNHNAELGTSQLGGVTPGNPNLRNSGPATVILNEVTSSNHSLLGGAIEVFGQRADVVVANPNGIICQGCGFIGTPRATLTTGTPDIDGTGRLSGFTVQGGDVTFGSKGGNFASGDGAVDLFDIVSRRVQIDGPVNGKQLRLSAGRQKFNYATGEATALDGADDAVEFAIDGSALGAMQADRIKIVVTDKGAGVRMRNDMAANAGELTLSADGKISLGNASGRDGVSIQSKSRQIEAKKVTSKKRVVVKAAKGITLEAVAADEDVILNSDAGLLSIAGDAASLGNIELTSSGAIVTGNIAAGKNARLRAEQGIGAGSVNADGAASLTTASGNIALSGTAKAGGGALNITATSGSISAASLVSFNNTSLTAGQDIHIGDAILSGGALVASARSIKATSAVSGVDFAATQASGGRIETGPTGELRLETTGGVDIASLLSAGKLNISAASLTAQNVTGHGIVTIAGDMTVSGQLLGSGDVSIKGANIKAGAIISGVDFTASKSSNGAIVVGNAGDTTVVSQTGTIDLGTLLSAGNFNANARNFTAANVSSHGEINISGTAAISGQLLSGSNISISGPSITLGTAVAGVDLSALSEGNVIPGSAGDLSLISSANGITADHLVSAGNMAVTASSTVTANIISHGDLVITAGDTIGLSGQSLSGGNAVLNAGSINLGTFVSGVDFAATEQPGGALALTAGQSGQAVLTASGRIDAGTLLSAGSLAVNAEAFAATNVTSNDTATIIGNTTISGQLLAGSDVSVTGAAINIATVVAGVDLIALSKGHIATGSTAHTLNLMATAGDLTAERLLASGSILASASGNLSANALSHGDLNLTAGGTLTLSGQSLSGGNATLNASAINVGMLVSGVDFAATEQSDGTLILKTGTPGIGTMTLDASNGSIVADQLVSGSDLKAAARQDITYNSLRSFASADLNAALGTISLDHDTVAKGNIALTLQSLDLSNNRSKLATAGTLIVHAGSVNLANSTLTFGGMDLNLSGAVDASDAKLRAVTADGGSGDISIAATTITTTAATALLAANDLTLTLASLTNAGQLAANRDLTFTLTGDLTNTPTALIYAGHDGRLFVNGNIFNDQGAILVSNDLAFANVAGNGKNTSLVNRAGLIQSGRNLSILTNYLKNETNGDPVIGEQQENGTRYSFGQPEHAEELWDNDTPMRGRLFYEPADSVKWGRGGCREKHGDDCDVTWLDKGLWNSKEDTYGYLTLPDGSVYKAFTWNEVGSNDGKGKIWYDWNANAAMAEQFQTQYFVAKPSAQGLIQSGVTLDINATTIDNLYSSIEAGGDATITSDHLTNKGVTLYRDFYMTCLAGAEICYGYNADGSRNASADISAGSSVMLRREAVDSLSATIRSGGALTLKVASLDGSTADGSIAGYSHYEAKPSTGDPLAALGGLTAGGALFTPNPAISDLLARKGISVSGNGIQAGGVPLSPEEILAALGSSAPKPTSGGFGGTVPGQIFIYETRAEFLDASKFYGSGYFLNRVGYQPDHQILFLGDAYFENQLIDKQMREAMGYGLNRSGADPVERMKSLLDNGVDYAASHGLAFGEPLTPEQVAALDQSIVVYVKQNIGGIEVFAPVLYVSPKDKGDAIASGSMIEGNIVTVSGDTINNSGLIASSTSLNVQAATITANGGGFAAKGDLTLAASGNIALNAGTTSFNGQTVVVPTDAVSAGGNAAIQSGQNVALNGVNVTAGQNLAVSGENVNIGTATGTSVDGSHNVIGSKLQSGGDTAIVAKNDITVSGSSVAAGGDLGLKAESGNLTIQSAEASRKDGFGETTTQQKAALSSGGSTDLEAGKNVVIAGSDVKAGGNLSINAGEGVAGIATQDHASGSFGSNSFVTTTQQGSSLTSGGDTSVKAGSDILIGGSSIDAGKNLDLNAKGDVNIVAMANTNEEQTNGRIFQRTESETRATGSSLKAGGDLSAKAGNDLNIIGSKLGADGKAALSAGHDVNILAAENTHDLDSSFSEKSGGPFGKKRSWTKDEHETAVVGSSVSGKSGVDITSGNNTTIAGSKVQAGTEDRKADLNINAGGDLIVASGKDTSEHDGSKSKSGFLSKKSDKNHTYDETTVGSELGASGNVNLSAGDNVAISGSKVTAGDNIAIEGDSVSIIGAQERHESASSSKKSGFGVGSGDGFYSIYGKKEKTNSEAVTANVGSELSAGNDVSIKARESDVNIVGSKVEAGHDIAIDAARDVNILPGAESYASEEKEKRGGVGIQVKSGEGSASIGIGYRSSKDETKQGAETNARSSLKAGNDIKINAGRDANLQAAKVEAEHDVAITAERDVNLLAAQDKTNYEHMHEELFAGVTAQVSTGVVGAAKSIGNAADKLSNVNDGYSAANAGFAGLKAIDGVNNLNSLVTLDENGNAKGNVASASVGIGFEYSKSKEKNESSIPVVTDIRAGNNISIEAKSGDINSHGSQIAAGYNEYGLPSGGDGDISLKAGNDINLQSAQATNSSSSSSTSAGASIGVSAGLSITGVTTGVTGSAHAGTSKSNGNGTVQVNTHVDGTGDIRIESGRDTNLKGAVVEGETITANVGRDLNIVSVPDTGENSNKSSSIGVTGSLSGGTPKVTGVSPGVGTGSGETNWIEEQSGLVSKGEMDVYVEGNTHLGAGKIVSESGDLKLDTGTLTHEDFSGSKKYEGFDVQANIGLTEKQQPDQTSQPNISAEGTYQLDDTRQEVRATVGPGEIIIRDKDKQAELEASGQTEDLAALNRDPDKAYEITKDKHVEIEYYLSDTSVKQAFQAGKTIAETFSNVLDQMVTDGKRTPEQAALSKEMFPFLDDPNVRAALAQCAQQHGAVDFSIFSWIVPLAHAQTGCPIPVNGQIKYFSPTQAGTCLADYDQMTGVVRGVIGATGTTIAGLAGAFLLASTTAAGTDINQKFTAGDGSTVLITGKGDQPFRQILVTYPDGTTANLTIETYDDGGAVRLTSGVIGTLPMTPSQLKDMGYVLTNAGVPNVVSQDGSSTLPGDLLGNNGRPGGKRINTDLPGVNPTPDELFDKLTGGKNTVLPDGTKVGDNGVRLRPDQGQGQRLDIPANGDKPHETIHFPSK